MFGLHTPEASDLHVCALSPGLPQKTVSGLSASHLCLCMHYPLPHNDRAVVLQDVLEGELTFRDGLSGQPSTCHHFLYL